MEREKGKIVLFKTLTILVCSAFLAAISIVLGKYLQIPLGDVMRFSFENTPILMAGMIFGPLVGGVVGAVADLIGCVMVGYTINPLVTIGAFLIGFISGTVYFLLERFAKCRNAVKISLSVASAHITGSVIVKTVGLAAYYSIPLPTLMLWRLLNYVIVGVLEYLILYYLLKNKLIKAQINSILNKK